MTEALSVAGEGALFFGRRPELPPDRVATGRPASSDKAPYPFAYARTAMKYGLAASGFSRGDGVLVPELICDSVIEPLDDLGIEAQYYPVDSGLRPDWDRLRSKVNASTRALLVVHYFGQPQRIEECADFCRERSLQLIEDNAHGHGASYGGRLLGTFGRMGVSAPRKTFPIGSGAYLYLERDADLGLSGLRPPPGGSPSLMRRAKSRLRAVPPFSALLSLRDRLAERRRREGPRPPYGSQLAFREEPIGADFGMDESDEAYMRRQDIEAVRTARRKAYDLWREWTASRGLAPVFPGLLPGAMPMVFPALAATASDSLRWFEFGHRNGIDIHSWPTLPLAVVKEDGEAMRLWERLVCFPVHQDMDPGALRRRLASAERYTGDAHRKYNGK